MTLGIVAIVIAIIAAAWTVQPMMKPRHLEAEADPETDRLIQMKHAVYRSMLDLEHDARLGKVSSQDADAIRAQHEAEAVAIIQQLDSHLDDPVEVLEREIAEARTRLREEGR